MPIASFIKPWAGYAVRHFPYKKGVKVAPLNFAWCGKSSENRWNVLGEPTLYLAQEKEVACAEFARHFQVNRAPGLAKLVYKRKVYRFKIELDYVIDLRDPKVCKALSLTKTQARFIDKKIARSTATFLRNTTQVQAIFVPSMAFPDDLNKWCLVVFLEKLGPNPTRVFKQTRVDGYFSIV